MMHWSQIRSVPFDSIDPHLPVFLLITGRIVLRGDDVGVLTEKMSPFTETNANVQNRARLQLAHNVDDGWNDIRAAARHKREVEAEKSSRVGFRQEGCS